MPTSTNPVNGMWNRGYNPFTSIKLQMQYPNIPKVGKEVVSNLGVCRTT